MMFCCCYVSYFHLQSGGLVSCWGGWVGGWQIGRLADWEESWTAETWNGVSLHHIGDSLLGFRIHPSTRLLLFLCSQESVQPSQLQLQPTTATSGQPNPSDPIHSKPSSSIPPPRLPPIGLRRASPSAACPSTTGSVSRRRNHHPPISDSQAHQSVALILHAARGLGDFFRVSRP